MSNDLFDTISNFENTARIPALRGVVHSSMAKCIGAIRQHIREQAYHARMDNHPLNDLDQRNEYDESIRSEDEISEAMGFDTKIPPLRLASLWHAVYDWADTELRTLITTQWDAPMTLEQMLEFMVNNAQKLDKQVAQALADTIKTDIKTIERMHELQAQREKEQLIEAMPEIIATFNGFGDNGDASVIDELPVILQHQLGIKVVESLNKARDQVLSRVLRTKRLAELGSIPTIEDAIQQISGWVEKFEQHHKHEIHEAIDAGRNVRTLDDVRA
jgi:hypothetical protein